MKQDTLAGQLLVLGFVTQAQVADARGRVQGRGGVGEALLALGHCTRDQLYIALTKRAEPGTIDAPRLGEVLVALEHLTEAKLRDMLAAQASDRRPLGELLIDRGACTFDQVYEGLVAQSQAANKHIKVIVVDDSSIVRRVVMRGLVDLGYDVVSFETPHQVLAELDHLKPDIVVTDLDMPDMDGAELCRRLKEASGNQLPVIILTANESQEATTGLRAGADDYVRKGTSIDELAARIDGILRRAQAASHVRKLFARYTSDAVVEQVLQAGDLVLGGEKRDVTVLFADIRDFTSYSETNAPEDVMITLNRILGKLADAVIVNGGTVDKFLGDGLMAVFGAPMRQDDHAERALAAGHRMLDALDGELLAIGVAVNSGSVVAGSIGNERRTEYTCIGDVVNVCSRLCGIAEPRELLVGHGTYARLERPDEFESLPAVKLKGKANPVPLYRAKRLAR
jgi:adenylate cyclase